MLAKYKNIKSFKIHGKSGQVKIDLGESIFQLLARLGEQGSILSVHTESVGSYIANKIENFNIYEIVHNCYTADKIRLKSKYSIPYLIKNKGHTRMTYLHECTIFKYLYFIILTTS